MALGRQVFRGHDGLADFRKRSLLRLGIHVLDLPPLPQQLSPLTGLGEVLVPGCPAQCLGVLLALGRQTL